MVTYRIEFLGAADAMVKRDAMVITSFIDRSVVANILLRKNAAWRTNKTDKMTLRTKNFKITLNASEKLIDIGPPNCILYCSLLRVLRSKLMLYTPTASISINFRCLRCYIFPRFILYAFFSFLLIYGGLGVRVLGLGSWIEFLGLGFSIDGVWSLWYGAFLEFLNPCYSGEKSKYKS
mgnify:CR=1 FL=1